MKYTYLLEILKLNLTPIDAIQIARLSDYMLGFGKHKGQTLDQIWGTDRTYLSWFVSRPKTDCKIQQRRVNRYLDIKCKMLHIVKPLMR